MLTHRVKSMNTKYSSFIGVSVINRMLTVSKTMSETPALSLLSMP